MYISRGDANTLLGQGRDALDNYIRAVNLSPMTPEVTPRQDGMDGMQGMAYVAGSRHDWRT